MKKKAAILSLAILFSNTVTFASGTYEKLAFEADHWQKNGAFVYSLHYGNASQLLSKINAPQTQAMDSYTFQYKPDERHFVRLQYGTTKTGLHGRGDDSDWTIYNSPEVLTDYGTMDFYGKETRYSVDLGKTLSRSPQQHTVFFIGWGHEKTYNELKNVVYHKTNSTDIGDVGQADNGSYLNADFGETHLGLETHYTINQRMSANTSLVLKHMDAKAYGHWANHTPAWNWVNSGEGWGYNFKIGLYYQLTKNTSTNIGYYYDYAKAARTNETLDTGTQVLEFAGIADLQYQNHGYYFSLQHKF